MPTLVFALIGGKLKVISGLAAASVSASSIPIALTAKSTDEKNIFTKEGVNQIENSLSNTSKIINSHLNDASSKLKEEYEITGGKMSDSVSEETIQNMQKQWKEGEEIVEQTYDYIHQNAKDINYYAFVLGNPTKSFILMIPKIIRDSIVHNEHTKLNQQLLSIQKIIAVSKKKEFEEFAIALSNLVTEHQKIIKDITMADSLGVLKIFREIREDDYDLFMKQVKENISQIQKEKNYKNATELLKDVFIGIDAIKKFAENKKKLKELLESNKDKLQNIDSLKMEEITSLIDKLSNITTQETN